ncbi:proton-coupled folate transporter isoform X2 [Hemiscyllium ocellatum]|uniref:proton-coupled folate transporter isoform X2 n=1 Tax=Hemiscyllium ocellatum TaxID=170820 RepID=UPI0029660D22|nr:proton-coupled folate transporter isoform X2 [Hemiscyllium ocellatum]
MWWRSCQICEDLYNKEDMCRNLSLHPEESLVTQSKAAYVLLLYTAVLTILSIPPSILLGAWSDQAGRKLGMILPSIGSSLGGAVLIVMVQVKQMSVYWCVFASALIGIFGNYVAIFLSVFSYVADITTDGNRTMRIGIVQSMIYIGGTVGYLLSGWLLQNYTFTHVFGVYCGCQVISIFYVLLWLRESNPAERVQIAVTANDRVLKKSIFLYASRTWETFSKARGGQDRLKLYLIFLCVVLIYVCSTGEQSILILFLTYPPQHFSVELYGIYSAIKMFLAQDDQNWAWHSRRGLANILYNLNMMSQLLNSKGATLIGLFPFMLHCVKEMTLAKVGVLVRLASLVLLGFSTQAWMVFLSAVMNSLSGFTGAVLQSVASNIVERNEQGAMFSCMASIETICVIIGTTVFDALYPQTLTSFPGFSFIVMAGFQVILLILVQWISEMRTSALVLPHRCDDQEDTTVPLLSPEA